jgi:hypothetical protein
MKRCVLCDVGRPEDGQRVCGECRAELSSLKPEHRVATPPCRPRLRWRRGVWRAGGSRRSS